MSLAGHLRDYVALCQSGRTLDAIERFYAEDVIVFENHERARVGKKASLQYERDALAGQPIAPRIIARASAADESASVSFVEWVVRYQDADGRPMRLEEVAVQRWATGQIVEERFYYEGAIDEGD